MAPKDNSKRYTGEPRVTETIGDKIAQAIISAGESFNERLSGYRETLTGYQDDTETDSNLYGTTSEEPSEDSEIWSLEEDGRNALRADD